MPIPKPPKLDDYNLTSVLEAVQEELIKLTEERERIDRRITKLQSDIIHLAALCRVEVEDPIRQLGLTDAIRYIFGREARPLGKSEVVRILEESYDVSPYKNLAANVHTIVRRLLKSGEIRLVDFGIMGRIGEQEAYAWTREGLTPPPPSQIISKTGTFIIEDDK